MRDRRDIDSHLPSVRAQSTTAALLPSLPLMGQLLGCLWAHRKPTCLFPKFRQGCQVLESMPTELRHALCSVSLTRRQIRSSCQGIYSGLPSLRPWRSLLLPPSPMQSHWPPGCWMSGRGGGRVQAWLRAGQPEARDSRVPHVRTLLSIHIPWLASRGQGPHPSTGDSCRLHSARGGPRILAG